MPAPIAQALTEYITFVHVGPPFDASSKVGTVTSTFASAWASITDQGGMMDAEDMQHQTQVQNFEIWIRYLDGLTGFMQIQWGDRTLIITGPPQKYVDVRKRCWWLIAAQEITERSFI